MKEILKKEKNLNIILVLGSIVVFTFLVFTKWTILYETPDDQYIMSILSGKLLGHVEAHVVYVKYPLAYLLTRLYALLPGYDWYATFMLGLQVTTMAVMLWYFVKKQSKGSCKVIATAVFYSVFMLCWTNEILSFTYTTTAALAAMCALVVYGLGEDRKRDFFLVILFSFFAFGLRSAVFFMVLPVAGVLWLLKMKERKQRIKQIFFLGVLFGMLLGIWGADHLAYSSNDWSAYNTYNQARTKLYDYNERVFSDYDAYKNEYASVGLTENDSKVFLSKNLALCDNRLFDVMPALADEIENETVGERLQSAVKLIIQSGFLKNKIMLLVSIICWGIAVLYTVRRKEKGELLLELILGILIAGLWLYLGYQGRIITRVAHSMLLLQIITPLICVHRIAEQDEKELGEKWKKCIVFGLLLIIVGASAYDLRMIQRINSSNQQKVSNQAYEKIEAYCNSNQESFYFGDVSSIAVCSYEYKFKSNTDYMNFLMLGDWYANSPLYAEKLEIQGIERVSDALLSKDNVYFFARKDLMKDSEYISDIYKKKVCLEEIDEIDVPGNPYAVYQLKNIQ